MKHICIIFSIFTNTIYFKVVSNELSMSPLVNSTYLNKILNEKNFDSKFRILEADLDKTNLKEYLKEHIPKAIYFDASFNSTSTPFISYDVPNEKNFIEFVQKSGISDKHHLIIYDRSKNGFRESARAWFLFKLFGKDNVSILNGGFNNYKSKNFTLDKKIPNFARKKFRAEFRPHLFKRYEDMRAIENIKNETIIDAREINEYNQSHIKGAINIPYSVLFDTKTSTLKLREELLKILKTKNINQKLPIVIYCQKNLRGSALMFALNYIGSMNTSLYIGSYDEYSKRSEKKTN